MQFGLPDAFYLLLLFPALVLLFRWATGRRLRRAGVLGDPSLVQRLTLRRSVTRERVKLGLLLACLFFLVLALARPQWGRGEEEVVAQGVDVFLVLDTSFSMDTQDVAPSRMERARYIASELMERLQGNRIGLVVFSGSAFVQCPLTLDYGAVRIFLDTVTTGIVPEPGTNIGQALEAARKGFVARDSKYRVVVLLTDGEQSSGDVGGIAETVREQGIVVHSVGVGTSGGEPIPVRNDEGEVTDYVRDESGQPVLSRLDEDALSRLALTTGGKYFRISDRDEEIDHLTELVMGMEGTELESQLYSRYQERFYWPLVLAVALLIAETLISRQRPVKEAL
jgi:Ca-activated chloride channel family protein